MVDKISSIYASGSAQPVKPTEKSDAKVQKRGTGNQAAKLIPNLHDSVEISEEGLKASQSLSIDGEEKVSRETTESISSGWYTAGYQYASSVVDSA